MSSNIPKDDNEVMSLINNMKELDQKLVFEL